MTNPIGRVKLRGRLTCLNLYEVDRETGMVTIGIEQKPTAQKDIRTNENGEYIVHGCMKYYLTDFEGGC